MSNPWYEVVRIIHPNIPDSEHDVPKDSLTIWQRSGWQVASQYWAEKEKQSKPEDVTAEEQELARQETEKATETKANTSTSSRKSATKTEEK